MAKKEDQDDNLSTDSQLIQPMDSSSSKSPKKNIIIAIIVIILGIVTGGILANNKSASTISGALPAIGGNKNVVGSNDTSTFKDMAEGTLQTGGIDGEGTHKLIRPGGESQTVYLTSTVLDLNQFVGKKVRVWGQTYSAKTAGWLMDVGRVEVSQ